MSNEIVVINGVSYLRDIEMIGDVEKIKWYNTKLSGYSEIYDQEDLDILEYEYVARIVSTFTPKLTII